MGGGYVKSNDLNRKRIVGDSSSDSEPQGWVIVVCIQKG